MYVGAVKEITSKALIDLFKRNKNIKLLDVRDVDFGEHAIIKDAINLPLKMHTEDNLQQILEESVKEKVDKLVCYCHTGPRSVYSADLFQKEAKNLEVKPNFDIAYLKGGILGFIETEGYKNYVE